MKSTLLGSWGEAKAAEYLRKKKYSIVAANFRTRFGEIDIIAENKKYIVFVEVKLRKSDEFAKAYEFVPHAKQSKIKSAATSWLSYNETEKSVRFDVIEIYAPDGACGKYKINHIEEAF